MTTAIEGVWRAVRVSGGCGRFWASRVREEAQQGWAQVTNEESSPALGPPLLGYLVRVPEAPPSNP